MPFWNSPMRPGDMHRYFARHAERVLWYEAALCPCSKTPRSPARNICQACFGLGYFYPNPPKVLRCNVTQVTQNLILEALGEMQPGDLVLEQQPGDPQIGRGDLILTQWWRGEPDQGETVLRASNTNVDVLSFRAQDVLWAGTVDISTGVATTYRLGTDFEASGRNITWIGNSPAPGQQYSIKYTSNYEWVCYIPAMPIYEFGTNLGPRATMRKRQIAIKQSLQELENQIIAD